MGRSICLGSSVDWGQDLKYLVCECSADTRSMVLAYHGFFELEDAMELPTLIETEETLQKDVDVRCAVSVNCLAGSRSHIRGNYGICFDSLEQYVDHALSLESTFIGYTLETFNSSGVELIGRRARPTRAE